MSYQTCCSKQLGKIVKDELKVLKSSAFRLCRIKKREYAQNCISRRKANLKNLEKRPKNIRWFFKILLWFGNFFCFALAWVKAFLCWILMAIIIIFWTVLGFISVWIFGFFWLSIPVFVLNGVLKTNLKNSIKSSSGKGISPNPFLKPGWKNTFYDEFEGETIDTSKWYPKFTDRPNPFSDYEIFITNGVAPKEYNGEAAIQVSNSVLKLYIDYEPKTFIINDWNGPIINPATGQPYSVTINYKAGAVVAKGAEASGERPFAQRFGFFETRCKVANSKATWPAFWLSGAVDWPPEIDIFEIYTSNSFKKFNSNYHWGVNNDGKSDTQKQCFKHRSSVGRHNTSNLSSDFHIYACEWDSGFIKWYFDNILVRVAHRNVTNIFEPLMLIINHSIDNMNSPNYQAALTLPAIFEIDYCRVYQKE